MPMHWSGGVDSVQYPVQEGVDPGVDAGHALGAAEPGPEADHADLCVSGVKNCEEF